MNFVCRAVCPPKAVYFAPRQAQACNSQQDQWSAEARQSNFAPWPSKQWQNHPPQSFSRSAAAFWPAGLVTNFERSRSLVLLCSIVVTYLYQWNAFQVSQNGTLSHWNSNAKPSIRSCKAPSNAPFSCAGERSDYLQWPHICRIHSSQNRCLCGADRHGIAHWPFPQMVPEHHILL